MKNKRFLILAVLFICSCGQDPLKASKSRLTTQSSSSPISCRSNSGVVCGQPPMPICTEGMMCAQMMPKPLSYDNECLLLQAGARYLYDGACQVQ